ncbi:MAG: autotransporter domain-containing protein [Selenomonas sp.]|uniref:autotransporter outer membrane beta-barrel domain-containing protein n=1 Tax=Selenomonas sp. TaxID=2053611 RepID=UPI0025FA7883|nr:autotransporter outer membrane beta-barrel domain-containing protein [Selenomonas sp.]MCR5758100.1 autotransporter domain-containing protein [Selenomonas sp.]
MRGKNTIMALKGKNKELIAAVTLACMGVPSLAGAYTTDYIYAGNQKFAEMLILNQGEDFIEDDGDRLVEKAQYTFSPALLQATNKGVAYWSGILGAGKKSNTPWQIVLTNRANYQNASAVSYSFEIGEDASVALLNENHVALGIQGKTSLKDAKVLDAKSAEAGKGMYAFSVITVGQHMGANRKGAIDAIDGWWPDANTILPTNEQAVDLEGTIRHELGHALGITGNFQVINRQTGKWDEGGIDTPQRTSDDEAISRFHEGTMNSKSWNMHLVDQNGKKAKPGMVISSSRSMAEVLAANPGLTQKDLFIVDNYAKDDQLTGAKGYAYFVGPHVTEALAGATFNGVSGLPVNGWESDEIGNYNFEGSHLQTTGMMSHRSYSNYTSFMEAELAVMQDLGYDLDRKAYYGYSVYGNGGVINNTHGYAARNAEGTAYTQGYSNIPLGVGLHIYGSRNTVTQNANILTKGAGATGIRVDGMENTLVIPENTEVHADGLRGNGVLIAYGRDQKVQQKGIVTAKGQGGTGIRFDFGSSSNGAMDEYRGSYIRYQREASPITGDIRRAENKQLTDMDKFTYNAAADELKGALVDRYDLSGTLQGNENAIYISKNALVKNINVQDGAQIQGNITSDWKHFATDGSYDAHGVLVDMLQLQYQGFAYGYDYYIPDLVTNLNFSGQHTYSGKITGSDNMKLNVKSGTLCYKGTADVLQVNVDKDAVLLGGNYKVNKIDSIDIAPGFVDKHTGEVSNHGTLGTLTAQDTVNITGNLVSDGTLLGQAGGTGGNIEVSGTADIQDSTLRAKNILPGEQFQLLTAGAVNGTPANDEKHPYANAMMNTTASANGTKAVVTATAANNLGTLEAQQQEAYAAVEAMRTNMQTSDDSRVGELRPLYGLSADSAKTALQQISSSGAPQLTSLVQQSTVSSRVISDRLNTAFSLQPAALNAPVSQLAGGDEGRDMDIQLETKLPIAQENNGWVKFTKNWGDLRGGANYHGSAISGGYDRAMGPNFRGGVFVSYNGTSFGADNSAGNAYDTRFGLYGGYHKDCRDAYVYLDYGIVRNKLHRGIPALGLNANADYNSHIIELGGEYKYDLQGKSGRVWHVSPYLGMQLSHLQQSAYQEKGAGVFNQQVDSQDNTYFAGTCGVEFKRYLNKGNYGMRLGVRHAFAGADPELSFRYEGYDGTRYTLHNNQDKTHFQLTLSGEAEFAPGWIMAGDAGFLRGRHDKDVTCALTLRKVW